MKQILIILSIIAASAALTGCLKDTPNVDFSGLKPIVEINSASSTSTANTLPSGLENFSNATLNFAVIDSTVTFTVNYASVNPPTSDVKVTVAVNDAARTAYNAGSTTQFSPFPAGSYSLPSTTATIKAGTRLATFTVNFYPSLLDPTQSYLLPITITDASGNTISGNFNTIYFHQIGNPLAGVYNETGSRWNYVGTVSWAGPPNPVPPGGTLTNLAAYSPKIAVPDDPTTIEIPFANVGAGYNYIITLNSDNTISVDYTFDAIYSNITTLVKTYDPTTKTIHIVTHYNNALGGAGNDRIIDETFVKQ